MWLLYAFITSWLYALYHIANQESKLKPEIFIIYRGLVAAIIATPFALAAAHIFPWQFYFIALLQGLAISYMDYKYFQAFHKFGAENVNSLRPLTVLITFIIWLILKPEIIELYLASPYRSGLIILSLCAMVLAITKYHNHTIGAKCIKYILPLLLLSSAIDTSNKVIMEYADSHLLAATINRITITGWLIGLINLYITCHQHKNLKQIIAWKNIRRSFFILLLILSMATINLSMYYTVNPAYTAAVIHLSIVWIIVINRIKKWRGYQIPYQTVSKKWIFLLLIAAIILIFATN